jgi:hypothetical protein
MPQLQNAVVLTIALLPTCFAPLAYGQAPAASQTAAAPVAYASVSELNGIVGRLRQTAQSTQADLGQTRIDKWKTDASTKRQVQGNVESIQRNLQSALPEILTQLESAPEDLSATFKLYRNLDALYDVFGSVVESAGAFGSKDEFQSLGNDLSGFENARRALAERMQNLAAAKESELTQLRGQIKAMQAAAPPPPPKRIIVDDTEPPKKPAVKKKPKPATPGTPATTTPAPTKAPTSPPGI